MIVYMCLDTWRGGIRQSLKSRGLERTRMCPKGANAVADPNAKLPRHILPIPDAKHVGLTTYDAKDPNTKYPPIVPLRPPDRRAERADRAPRRCRLRRLERVWRTVQHAHRRTPCGQRPEVQPLPYDRFVLADAPGDAHRSKPSFGRHGRDHRNGDVGAGQQQHPAQGKGAAARKS